MATEAKAKAKAEAEAKVKAAAKVKAKAEAKAKADAEEEYQRLWKERPVDYERIRKLQHKLFSLSERTKYPKLFNCIYWGGFKDFTPGFDDKLLNNRNSFVESHPGIKHKKWLKRVIKELEEKTESVKEILDHNEYYYTPTHWLFITSPYDTREETTKCLTDVGFILLPRMYSTSANTFLLTIPVR